LSKLSLGALKNIAMLMAKSWVESVGFIIGSEELGVVKGYAVYRADNIRSSPVEFEAKPWHTIQAHIVADKYNLKVVGIIHTHPSCPPAPSILDIEGMVRWPLIWVIACESSIAAYILKDNIIREVEIID